MNRRAFLLGAAMVLLGSVVLIAVRAFTEAAFLAAYGPAQMPWLLVANATGFALATLGYDVLTRTVRASVADPVLLLALAAAAGAAPTLLEHGAPPVVLVVALTASSQVAGLVLWNRVSAAVGGRDARRYLPRAGAASTVGAAIAGLGIGALIPRVGLVAVPYLAAAVTVVVLAVCLAQQRALVSGGAPGLSAPPTSTAEPPALGSLQRRLVAALVVVAVLEGLVGTVVDLQFLALLRARYTGDDLAVALAVFYGVANAILLVVQTTAVPRLLVTRAMTFTTAIHPTLVLVAYVGFAAAPGFFAIAATRMADQVLRFATSRPAQELELSALPPAAHGRWKVLLRGAVWPAATAAAALALLVAGPVAVQSPATLAAVACAIALAWVFATRVAARRFQAALAAPLGIRTTRAGDALRIDLDTLERWVHASGSGDAKDAALARAALLRARVDATDLADHLRHDGADVRAALFDQLAREPAPALHGELRAAIAIEQDDRALVLGIRALAIAGDSLAVTRGKERALLDRGVDAAVHTAELMLGGGDPDAIGRELDALLVRDPAWATAFVRARTADVSDELLDARLRAAVTRPQARRGAFDVIARVGPTRTRSVLGEALAAGDADAIGAIRDLDREGAASLAADLDAFLPAARTAIARALGAAPSAADVLAALVADADPEVAHTALRSALAFARGGGVLASERIAAASSAARVALDAHLAARDAAAMAGWSPCVHQELAVATRRCVARALWAAALEATAGGRDPAPLAATARHLVDGGEADRRRALDVVQELETRGELLALIERWLAPARPVPTRADGALVATDPWFARLLDGELRAIEPVLADLRRSPLFATIAGPVVEQIAERARHRRVDGRLFDVGDTGDTMFVVRTGALVATRPGAPERRLASGDVAGELAMLSQAPRPVAVAGTADVLEIDRATFTAAAQRAPELVLALSAMLARSLAPTRPDVL